MKIVAISDVHGKWNKITIPECNLLISCGDYSFRGETHMVKDFHKWLNKQPATHIISVQGNHELQVQHNFNLSKQIAQEQCPRVHFMEEGLVEIEDKKIWCSAWTPWFYDWAYNARRGEEIQRHWDLIPQDIDILVTHGPPAGVLDTVIGREQDHLGCLDLMDKINQLPKLKYHFFGHIHSGHGTMNFNDKTFFNVSICDEQYKPTNPVTEVEIA